MNIKLPFLLLSCFVLTCFASCRSRQIAEIVSIHEGIAAEHSPTTFLVMYDSIVGKSPLLQAVKEYKATIVYDYSIIPGMAIRKPDDKTLEETMQHFRKVQGVLTVEYDHIYRLTDPVRPVLLDR